MTTELVTAWEFDCPRCGFHFVLPITADDPNGDYAHDIVMTHVIECGTEES